METLTLITATCDQPIGFALCETYMARQTWPLDRVQWIVVDDGLTPIVPTLGQEYVRRRRERERSGSHSLGHNLLLALTRVKGTHVAFIEHDDWYAPTHLEQLVRQLREAPQALAAGDDDQRYYHVKTRWWRTWINVGSCLCQTMIRREACGRFEAGVRICLERDSYGMDAVFWRGIRERWALARKQTVVGIKGLPGRRGLGVGHRPDKKWTADPDLEVLRSWMGNDADRYAVYGQASSVPALQESL